MDNSTPTLNVTRTETAPCCLKVSVEMPPERVQKIYENVLQKVATQVKLPGFRAGKIPRAMLLTRFEKEVKGETLEQLVSTGFRGMVEQEKLDLTVSPQVENMESLSFELGQPFTFTVLCECVPQISLPEYKGLHLSREVVTVSEAQVDEFIASWLESRQSYVKVERPVQQQDMLRVSYKAELPAEIEVSDKIKYLVEAENTWMVLREPEMLPGVMTVLVGLSTGDTKDTTLSFPADFREAVLAGKSLPYHIEIKEVHGREVPALTEEFAKEAGMASVADLRTRVRGNLESQAARTRDQQLREQLVSTVVSGLDFALPPTPLKQEQEALLKEYYDQEVRNGKKPEELREMSQEMATKAEGQAAVNLRRRYVLEAIAKAEKVRVENHEINSMVSYFAQYERVSPKAMVKRLEENGQIPGLIANLTETKTIDALLKLADITDVPAADAK